MEDEEKGGKKSGQSGTKRDVQWWKNMLHDETYDNDWKTTSDYLKCYLTS